jgi:hypothetical protein
MSIKNLTLNIGMREERERIRVMTGVKVNTMAKMVSLKSTKILWINLDMNTMELTHIIMSMLYVILMMNMMNMIVNMT